MAEKLTAHIVVHKWTLYIQTFCFADTCPPQKLFFPPFPASLLHKPLSILPQLTSQWPMNCRMMDFFYAPVCGRLCLFVLVDGIFGCYFHPRCLGFSSRYLYILCMFGVSRPVRDFNFLCVIRPDPLPGAGFFCFFFSCHTLLFLLDWQFLGDVYWLFCRLFCLNTQWYFYRMSETIIASRWSKKHAPGAPETDLWKELVATFWCPEDPLLIPWCFVACSVTHRKRHNPVFSLCWWTAVASGKCSKTVLEATLLLLLFPRIILEQKASGLKL